MLARGERAPQDQPLAQRLHTGFRVEGSWFMVHGSWLRVEGWGFGVQGSVLRL